MGKCTLCSEDALYEEECLTSASSPEAVHRQGGLFEEAPFKGSFLKIALDSVVVRQCVYLHVLPAPDAGATCFPSHCTAVSLCTISEMAF